MKCIHGVDGGCVNCQIGHSGLVGDLSHPPRKSAPVKVRRTPKGHVDTLDEGWGETWGVMQRRLAENVQHWMQRAAAATDPEVRRACLENAKAADRLLRESA